jgi:hypothetical protein
MNLVLEPRSSPYQGLIPYSEKDAEFFFGREKDTRLIIANLYSSPLTTLYGPSGVGKSSVLRAGAVHQLRQRSDLCVIFHSDWKDNPLTRLKVAAGGLSGLDRIPNMELPLAEFLAECATQLKRRLMIVLDQFEEYFLYHPQDDDFTIQFSKAVMQTEAPINFLIAIREDALAKLDRFEGRIPILFDNYLRLEHLDSVAARSAIEKPLEKYNELYLQGKPGIQIEAGLANEVLRQLKSGQVSLQQTGSGVIEQGNTRTIETPYLQLVMRRLWQSETSIGSPILRLTTLNSLGGAEKIVRTHLDGVLNQLTRSERFLASRILQYLVTPSGTKIALRPSDLATYADASPRNVQLLLHRLIQPDIRLLRAVQTSGTDETSYEIFHDVLASPILNWRARQVRSSRSFWLIIVGVIILCACSYGLIALAPTLAGQTSSEDIPRDLFSAVLVAVCSVVACLIPITIGFFIGRGWARAR